MTGNLEKTMIFQAFKTLLKERGVTYSDLAERTRSSESTIKRIFSLEECSLTRLVEMLDTVGLSLSDVVAFAAEKKVESSTFSIEAEEFLARSLDYFFVSRKLFHHRSVTEVRRREKLSQAAMTKYLKKLDDLKVLKWMPEDKIHFLHADFLRFRDDGPLKKAVYKAWAPKLHALALNNMGDGRHTLRLFSARCSQDLQKMFYLEFEELIDSFLKRAALEQRTQPNKLDSIALRVGLDMSDMT
jgi:transcriptional regulator with XRE-family HTH domain